MTLPLFTTSPACRGGRLCGRCRQPSRGRALRASLAKAYTLPADAPDFECPHGKPWAIEMRPPEVVPEGWDEKDYARDSRGTEPCSC